MVDKKTKQFLVDRFTEKWMKDNKDFFNDYQELCEELLLFKFKWGIEVGIILKNSEEIKGRELGKGVDMGRQRNGSK